MTFKTNRAHLLCPINLNASFNHNIFIQTGVTVQKRLNWGLTSVTLTFDLWPWPFSWKNKSAQQGLINWLILRPESISSLIWHTVLMPSGFFCRAALRIAVIETACPPLGCVSWDGRCTRFPWCLNQKVPPGSTTRVVGAGCRTASASCLSCWPCYWPWRSACSSTTMHQDTGTAGSHKGQVSSRWLTLIRHRSDTEQKSISEMIIFHLTNSI